MSGGSKLLDPLAGRMGSKNFTPRFRKETAGAKPNFSKTAQNLIYKVLGIIFSDNIIILKNCKFFDTSEYKINVLRRNRNYMCGKKEKIRVRLKTY